jgi:hypothetical protein
MVAQLAGNRRGHRLRQGVAGTSLLPGPAVYTMPMALSLFLCNGFIPRAVNAPVASKRFDGEYQDAAGSLSGRSTIAFVLSFFGRSIVSQPVESSKHFLKN